MSLQDPWDCEDAEPLKPQRKLLERDIQSKCVDWARTRGWWARKFSSPANRSVPDYIFGKWGCTLFVEFKAPGKKPTDAQADEHKAMYDVGLMAHIIDDVSIFKRLFTEWECEIKESKFVNSALALADARPS
jgi:hypothetical protein